MNGNQSNHKVSSEAIKLAKDAKALLEATAESAEERVILARNKLSEAIERGKEKWEAARDAAVEGVEAGDAAIQNNTYMAVGIAFAAGTALGLLLRGRR